MSKDLGSSMTPNPSRSWKLPLWQSLLPIGRSDETGGYRRFSFTPADMA